MKQTLCSTHPGDKALILLILLLNTRRCFVQFQCYFSVCLRLGASHADSRELSLGEGKSDLSNSLTRLLHVQRLL